MICPSCKVTQPDTYQFCQKCGFKLNAPSVQPTAASVPPPPKPDYQRLVDRESTKSGWCGCLGLVCILLAIVALSVLFEEHRPNLAFAVIAALCAAAFLFVYAVIFYRRQRAYQVHVPRPLTDQERAAIRTKEHED